MDSEENKSTRVCLCVLCGLPAAGKTTLAQAVNTLTVEQGWRSIVIVYDDMIPDHAFHIKVLEEDDSLMQSQKVMAVSNLSSNECACMYGTTDL